MSKIKQYYENEGYRIGEIIREDLPGWEQWFEEDEEEGSLEDQVVTLLLTCQFNRLLFILWDLVTDLPEEPTERVKKVIEEIEIYKNTIQSRIESMILYGNYIARR